MSGSNSWAEFAATFRSTPEAFFEHREQCARLAATTMPAFEQLRSIIRTLAVQKFIGSE
jgi:hypothetical protein